MRYWMAGFMVVAAGVDGLAGDGAAARKIGRSTAIVAAARSFVSGCGRNSIKTAMGG